MKKYIYIAFLLLIGMCVSNCTSEDETESLLTLDETESENPDDESNDVTETVEGELQGSIMNLGDSWQNDYTVETMWGETSVEDGCFSVKLEDSGHPQMLFVTNSNDEVIMMSRDVFITGEAYEISVESSAIALVTIYPLFSFMEGDEYDEMKDIIKSLDGYQSLYWAVYESVESGNNLLDESNETITNALEIVFEELDDIIINNMCATESRAFSGADVEDIDCDPIDIVASSNTLTMRIFGLAPTYNGSAQSADGTFFEIFEIKTRDDYGVLDLFTKTASNWQYGESVKLTLTIEGEYRFTFERDISDFASKLVVYVLNMLGITSFFSSDMISEFTTYMFDSLVYSDALEGDFELTDLTNIAYNTLLAYYSSNSYLLDLIPNFADAIYKLNVATRIYNSVKDSGNIIARVCGWINNDDIEFVLCCYDYEIMSCNDERQWLKEFYYASNGDNWKRNTNWCTSKPLSEWYGIEVDNNGHVNSLNLLSNNLVAESLYVDLNGLPKLETFNIDYNISIENLSIIGNDIIEKLSITECATGYIYFEDFEDVSISCSSLSSVNGECTNLYVYNCDFGENEFPFGGVAVSNATISDCCMFNCGLSSETLLFMDSTTYNTWYCSTSKKLYIIDSYCSTICRGDFEDYTIINLENATLWQSNWDSESLVTLTCSILGYQWYSLFESDDE